MSHQNLLDRLINLSKSKNSSTESYNFIYDHTDRLNSFSNILKKALKEGIYQAVPNFDAAYANQYFNIITKHFIKQKENSQTKRFFIYSESFSDKIYGEENLENIKQLIKNGYDFKIIHKNKLDNKFLQNNKFAFIGKNHIRKDNMGKSFPVKSCIVSKTMYAEQTSPQPNKRAVFLVNLPDEVIELSDAFSTRFRINKKKNSILELGNILWDKCQEPSN